MKSIRNSKGLYWGLIATFFVLYFLVGFVSTLHSITFFELANVMWMAVLLGITYEVGQAAVLFSILMSDNNKKFLPWALMILLTALQVTANVYASFKFMDSSGSNDWTFWQRSILFWLEADGPEMFKVIISWITGALLPVVALGMTALVAENLKLKDEQDNKDSAPLPPTQPDEPKDDELPWEKDDVTDEDIENLKTIISGGSGTEAPVVDLTPPKEEPKIATWSGEESISPEDKDWLEPDNEYFYDLQDDKIKEKHPNLAGGYDPEKYASLEEYRDLQEAAEERDKKNPLGRAASQERFAEELLKPENQLKKDPAANKPKDPISGATVVKEPFVIDIPEDLGVDEDSGEPWKPGLGIEIEPEVEAREVEEPKKFDIPVIDPALFGKGEKKKPQNNPRGWHLKENHIDINGDVYRYGEFQGNDPEANPDPPKKA